jgi:hypothetical protein
LGTANASWRRIDRAAALRSALICCAVLAKTSSLVLFPPAQVALCHDVCSKVELQRSSRRSIPPGSVQLGSFSRVSNRVQGRVRAPYPTELDAHWPSRCSLAQSVNLLPPVRLADVVASAITCSRWSGAITHSCDELGDQCALLAASAWLAWPCRLGFALAQ